MAKALFPRRKSSFSDNNIVSGLQANDRKTVEYLYQVWYPMTVSSLSKLGASADVIEDVFQESIIALWKNVQDGSYQVRANTKLSTYFIEICRRKWFEILRKQKKKLPEPFKEEPQSLNVLEEWMKAEELEAFRNKFKQLGKQCQDLLKQFYFEKKSMQEIAALRSLTPASAKNQKYRCMQRLKAIFKVKNEES